MYNIKLKKYHIPSVNKKNLNLVSLLYEIMIILLLNLFFIISGISPIEAILNPLGFRTAIHSGEIVFLNIFFNFIFYFLSILMFIDTFKKNNLIKPYSKFILLLLLFYYSIACGARGFLVYFIFYLVMSFTFYKKIKIKDCLIGLVILIILSIFNSIYLQYRNIKNDLSKAQVSLTTTQSYSKLSLLEDIAKRNDSFANSIVFFKWYKEKNNDLIINNPNHIMEETTYHCLAYIPRKYKNMIYDNDDQGFLFTIMMTNKLYNNAYYREGISYDIGGIANCYWNFGIIGICIGGFLFGSLICFMQILFDLYYTNEIFIAFYLLIGYPLLDSFFKVGFINAPLTINLIFNILIFYIISILSFKTLKFKY